MKKSLVMLLCATSLLLIGCKGKNDFENSKGNGSDNGYEYIDMGLSVRWAKVNIGATSQSEIGSYFSWGEISPKNTYSPDNYHYTGTTKLPLSDDAANMNWGGEWRMPTISEWKELMSIDNCIWTWTTEVGMKGYKVESKKTGNYIFLPAGGFHDISRIYGYNVYGDYRTSTNSYNVPVISETEYSFTGSSGYVGMPIRPVHP